MNILQKNYHRYLPKFLKRIIDPATYRIDQFVISNVKLTQPGGLLLDAGAGECRFKDMLSHVRYVAIDASCGDRAWDYTKIDVLGTIDRLPFPVDLFDTAICTEVLEHVKEPQIVLNEIFRVLKPGGLIFLTTPQGWGIHQAPHDYFRFTSYGLNYLFERAGFEIDSIQPSCGYYGYLANRLTVFPKTLFWQIEHKWVRLLLLPGELLSYLLFVILLPLVLNAMDPLDRKRQYTLNYFVKGRKPAETQGQP